MGGLSNSFCFYITCIYYNKQNTLLDNKATDYYKSFHSLLSQCNSGAILKQFISVFILGFCIFSQPEAKAVPVGFDHFLLQHPSGPKHLILVGDRHGDTFEQVREYYKVFESFFESEDKKGTKLTFFPEIRVAETETSSEMSYIYLFNEYFDTYGKEIPNIRYIPADIRPNGVTSIMQVIATLFKDISQDMFQPGFLRDQLQERMVRFTPKNMGEKQYNLLSRSFSSPEQYRTILADTRRRIQSHLERAVDPKQQALAALLRKMITDLAAQEDLLRAWSDQLFKSQANLRLPLVFAFDQELRDRSPLRMDETSLITGLLLNFLQERLPYLQYQLADIGFELAILDAMKMSETILLVIGDRHREAISDFLIKAYPDLRPTKRLIFGESSVYMNTPEQKLFGNEYQIISGKLLESLLGGRKVNISKDPGSLVDRLGVTQPCCGHCGSAPQKLLTCSACRSVYYCNAICQKANWSKHKVDCKK